MENDGCDEITTVEGPALRSISSSTRDDLSPLAAFIESLNDNDKFNEEDKLSLMVKRSFLTS